MEKKKTTPKKHWQKYTIPLSVHPGKVPGKKWKARFELKVSTNIFFSQKEKKLACF